MMRTINLVKVLPGPSEGEGTRRLHTYIRLSAALYVYGIDRILFSSHWALLVSPGEEAKRMAWCYVIAYDGGSFRFRLVVATAVHSW